MTLKMTFDIKITFKHQIDLSYGLLALKTMGKSGISQGCSGNRSCNLAFAFLGGGHIEFCASRPPEVELSLFAVVFENLMPISNTIPN